MAMKFLGTWSELKKLLAKHDVFGSWEREPNDVHMLRCPDGANLHWANGSKSLWIDGKPGPRRSLERYVAKMLSENLSRRPGMCTCGGGRIGCF